MKKLYLFITICLIASFSSFAQYKYGIGARVGLETSLGIDFKQYLDNRVYGELIGTSRWGGYSGTALFAFSQSINKSTLHSTALYWFLGGGVHVGRYDGRQYVKDLHDQSNYHYNNTGDIVYAFGVDVVVGLEYEFRAPFSIALEARPYYTIVNPSPDYFDAALTLRYVFGKR